MKRYNYLERAFVGWHKGGDADRVVDDKTGKYFVRFTVHGGGARLLYPLIASLCVWTIHTYYFGDRSLLEGHRFPASVLLAIALFFAGVMAVGLPRVLLIYQKIDVFPEHLVVRSLFFRRRSHRFEDLIDFTAGRFTPKTLGPKCVSWGVILHFRGAKPLEVRAQLHGYKDLLDRLSENNAALRAAVATSFNYVNSKV